MEEEKRREEERWKRRMGKRQALGNLDNALRASHTGPPSVILWKVDTALRYRPDPDRLKDSRVWNLRRW